MKYRLIAAALVAFFMLPVFSLTAFATQIDDIPGDISSMELVGDAPETGEALGIDTLDTDTDETPPDYDAETPEVVELPALPPGTGTIIDYNTDPDGRLFYTIMTPDEHVFYLVIDKSSNANNVYFLNAVTIADLAALAEIPATTPGGTLTPPPPATETPEQPTETPPPAEQEQPQSGGNMGMYIFIIVLAIAGGGAGWYFKIYRPKQQGAASGEEYDPSMDETENDYTADWGEDSDEAAEGDDSPPWDEDGESGDEE